MDLPEVLQEGAENVITLEMDQTLKIGFGEYKLSGVSSSGLPVHYYIEYGPATIIGSDEKDKYKLVLSDIPVCA